MQSKVINDTLVIRGFKGEDIVEIIAEACKKHNVKAGYLCALGATDNLTIGVFNPDTKNYAKSTYKGAYEILNLTGNISTMNGEVYTHLHITVAGEDLRAIGGHLNSAIISVTFEAFIKIINGIIDRIPDEEMGINIMDF